MSIVNPCLYRTRSLEISICETPHLLTVPLPLTLEAISDLGDDPTLVRNPGNTVRFSWNAGACGFVVTSDADNFVSASFWLFGINPADDDGGGAVCRIIE